MAKEEINSWAAEEYAMSALCPLNTNGRKWRLGHIKTRMGIVAVQQESSYTMFSFYFNNRYYQTWRKEKKLRSTRGVAILANRFAKDCKKLSDQRWRDLSKTAGIAKIGNGEFSKKITNPENNEGTKKTSRNRLHPMEWGKFIRSIFVSK